MSFAPKHILVPVAIDPDEDFHLAEHAVFAACDIAEKFSSTITLLHLSPTLMLGTGPGIDVSGKVYQSFMAILEARLARGKLKIKELQEEASRRGITVEGRVVDSLESTASVIIDTAQELKADLLVIGSHGRHGLSRLLFGSVAEKVAEKASIPVLLLHPGKKA
jgi:nucleotide-binding universal stress UspA family protein